MNKLKEISYVKKKKKEVERRNKVLIIRRLIMENVEKANFEKYNLLKIGNQMEKKEN